MYVRRSFIARGMGARYRATMMDHGFCLEGQPWDFRKIQKGSSYLYQDVRVYQDILGIDCFDPWLTKLEDQIRMCDIPQVADGISPEGITSIVRRWHRSSKPWTPGGLPSDKTCGPGRGSQCLPELGYCGAPKMS
jgi:hypothetical protein